MTIAISTFKDDIDRAYRVLGGERAEGQNWRDIHAWKKQGYISYEEERELLRYNRYRHAEECAKGNY